MFIQTEATPNPATMKFLPGRAVMETGTADFTDPADAEKRSPLAAALFGIDGVEAVFFGSDFITVTKSDAKEWHVLKPSVLGAVMEHFTAGAPVMNEPESTGETATSTASADDDEVVVQIKELIDTRIRPAVAMDGGDIVFESFDEGIVYLQMQGACSGCPSSTATLKMGIENMLKHYVPEVIEVRAVGATF
jgi:Fe-S cluster biogenesis protein NfuA